MMPTVPRQVSPRVILEAVDMATTPDKTKQQFSADLRKIA
jgi:hypothetical protein